MPDGQSKAEAGAGMSSPSADATAAARALCPDCGAECGAEAGARCATCGAEARLRERYLLRRVLGANVGTTYLADDLQSPDVHSPRPVVIKELQFARQGDWKTEELFAREAEVLRQLDHPRIPRYLDSFSEGQGKRLRSYLVQERMDGVDLRAELQTRRHTEDDVLIIVDEVLAILEYLQGLNPPIIHRDLKPSNLMRLRDGHIALIDFGSVRDLVAPSSSNATVAGTFGFMAPEQFQGDAFLQTDLYGLGAVALQLLSRVSPDKMLATGTQLAWRAHVRASEPMLAFLEHLLAVEPTARPADATAARALVRETQRARSHPAPRERPLVAPATAQSRPPKRTLPRAVAAVLLVAAAGAGFCLMQQDRWPPPRGPAAAAPRPTAHAPTTEVPPAPPRRTPAPPPSMLARDLPREEMVALLTAQPWTGSLNGSLTFTESKGALRAWLQAPEGPMHRLRDVTLGPLATLSMKLVRRVDGVTTTDTFHGGLAADRRSLLGSYERRFEEGVHDQREEGRWQVTAQGAPPR